MRLILIFWLLAPLILWSQASYKQGTISFDFGKKKSRSIDTSDGTIEEPDTIVKHKKLKTAKSDSSRSRPITAINDYRRYSVFRGIAHGGINFCQIDGDNEYGYKYIGAAFGVGVLARFHRLLSTSVEINYSMKGARSRLPSTATQSQYYQVQWDYIEAALGFNIHIKELVMLSVGLAPGYMVRYREYNYDDIEVTRSPPFGQPSRFDLAAQGGVHFVFRQHYAVGFQFHYSMLKIRTAAFNTRVDGQYNNYLTLRFMYLIGGAKKR
jgi:hypothetical protein